MNHYAFSCLIASVSTFILGLLVYLKNRRSLLNIMWALFEFSISLWCFSQFIESTIITPHWALFWNRLMFLGIIFIPICFFHATVLLLEQKTKILPFVYGIGFCFVLFLSPPFSDLFIKDVVLRPYFGYYTSPGVLYSFFMAFFGLTVIYAFVLMFNNLYRVTGIKRQQLKYVLIGSGIGFVLGSCNFLPAYNLSTSPYINYLFAFCNVPILYGIIRYRLMDVRLIATRSGIFVATYSLILGTPLLIIYFWQNELVVLFGSSWWIVPFLFSTTLATLGPFLYIYFDSKAENRLLREQKNYQNILRGASSGMIRIRNLDLLLKLIVYVITKIVRIKHSIIYLLNEEGSFYVLKTMRAARGVSIATKAIDMGSPLIWQLNKDKEPLVTEEFIIRLKEGSQNTILLSLVEQLTQLNAALIVPSFVEDRLIGILVLGEKRSGKMYSQDDLAVFSVLANQAALAIENAQFYEEIRKTQESLFQAEKMATIGTMADGLSHQINNRFHALSLIAGDSLDVIKNYDCSQCSEKTKQIFNDLKNSLERIQANVLQGGEVVKGLLKYSRPGQGGFERVSFKDVLDGAVEMVSYKIKLREIDLIRDIPSNLPCLNANIVQLQEVFFNLIDNAYDAIKERQAYLNEEGYRGRIEISAMTDQTCIHVNVQDNGIGIKTEDVKKLYTPFFTTKATSRKGTGLGLYVIEKIIASHSGQLKIDSVYRSGTCFTVSLPVKPALAAA
ncbi:MAG: ATP-binding protein [Patescibacteria group bacterium]